MGNNRNDTYLTFEKTMLLFGLLTTSSLSIAQAGFGASGTVNMFTKKMGQFISFGPIAEVGIADNKYSIRASYNYFLPKNYSGTTVGYYLGNATNGQAVNVDYTEKYHIMTIALDAKRYVFKNGNFTDGGVYAGIGAGIVIENVKTNYSPYDSQKYYIRSNSSSVSYNQLMFRGLLGYEIVAHSGCFFSEIMVIVPTNSVNAEGSYTIEVPLSFAFQMGYKYLIR
jgi:hypothetical protein